MIKMKNEIVMIKTKKRWYHHLMQLIDDWYHNLETAWMNFDETRAIDTVKTATRLGTTRIVFLVGDYAFKLPRPYPWRNFLQGFLANMQEEEFSRMESDHLCPIVFRIPGGALNVMPRARMMTIEEWADFDYDQWIKEGGENISELIEGKRCSFGVLGDRIVAVDYGS